MSTTSDQTERLKLAEEISDLEKALRLPTIFSDGAASDYPPFEQPINYAHGLPLFSLARKLQFRPTNYIVRTYSPHGLTPNGLYVEKNEKWPRVWAHVLACSHDNVHCIIPGDLILFKRHCEEHLGYDEPLEAEYLGEKLPVEILNYKAITAIIMDVPISVRI